MGYANYFKLKPELKRYPTEFIGKVKLVIKNSPCPLTQADYNKQEKPIAKANEICLNGVGKDGYESFWLPLYDPTYFHFCKTAHQPYDAVVKAILILAERYDLLADGKFTFDGDRRSKEYRAGKKLADLAEQQFDAKLAAKAERQARVK